MRQNKKYCAQSLNKVGCALFIIFLGENRLITSPSNEKIKFLKTLKTKKGRENSGCFLLEGRRAVCDAAKKNVPFELLIVEENKEFDVVSDCERIIVSRRVIEVLSDTDAPEGIIALVRCRDLTFSKEKLSGDTVVFLDRLQDAGNLGTVIRTADASGAGAVILSKNCVELYNPKTVRSTMSSLFSVTVMKSADDEKTLSEIKAAGYTLCAADLDGENFFDIKKEGKNCIIIGNEGNGICEEVLALADRKITLPMRGGAESLNASVAAGILIYGFTFDRK